MGDTQPPSQTDVTIEWFETNKLTNTGEMCYHNGDTGGIHREN
jgi:hypothetical protein